MKARPGTPPGLCCTGPRAAQSRWHSRYGHLKAEDLH
jgi:hypothetical protein